MNPKLTVDPQAALAANIFIGTIGFFASWLFVLKIYKSIKVD